jgi:excisionase family DNA binding protein
MDNSVERDWLTIKEAAAVANVSRETLLRYMKLRRGKPPSYKLVPNGRWRFPIREFSAWVRGEKERPNV